MKVASLTASIALVLLLAGTARAQPAPAPAPPVAPWAVGVSATQQQAAEDEYVKGNAAFSQDRYTEALAAYERAIAQWDNPQIQFNAAMCLMFLDRPLEAYRRMERALAYGEAPFDNAEKYQQAQLHRKSLRAQLVELTVAVNVSGSTISVDGAPVTENTATMMLAGLHQIVVSKPGYVTETKGVVARGGSSERVAIELRVPSRELTRRWKPWIPWTVAGAGAGVTGLAVVFHVLALRSYARYEDRLLEACPMGCNEDRLEDSVVRHRRSGDIQRVVAISAYVLGGAAIATGIVMVVMNRERLVEPSVTVTPVEGGAAAVISGRF